MKIAQLTPGIITSLLVTFSACSTSKVDVDAATSSDAQATTLHERLWVGTGEYDAKQNWHAILKFDPAESLSGEFAPQATLPVNDLVDSSGVHLSFGHGLFLDEANDELYVAALFTRQDGQACSPCNPQDPVQPGSIGVISGASKASGKATLTRHIFGGDDPASDKTTIVQPHGVWKDNSRNILYVANTFGSTVLAFHDATHANGNVAPTRTFTSPMLGNAVFPYLDEGSDRLFIASMGGRTAGGTALLIFNNASTTAGAADPNVRITGDKTRLGAGNNQTTHNVWYSGTRKLIMAAHHTNEILLFDANAIDMESAATRDYDIAPRVIDASESDATLADTSVYGLFYLEEQDRMYVSVGIRGDGSKANRVVVYENVSSAATNGRVAPARTIQWTTRSTYYPPQPLWVTRY